MITYADYEFYKNIYNGKMSEEVFLRHALDASNHIRRVTMRKSDGFDGEELKYATCAVADAFDQMEKQTVNGVFITSENNDGYSVSYDTSGNSLEQEKFTKANVIMRTWLNGTGLLSRRCSRVSKC